MAPATDRPSSARSRTSFRAGFARERDSLRAVVESIGREADLGPLLDRILDHPCELLDADRGAIGLVDETRHVVRMVATRDMPAGELGAELPIGFGLVGYVVQTRAAIRDDGTGFDACEDTAVDRRRRRRRRPRTRVDARTGK